MTTSGTYNFSPSLGEITIYAFNLCGIRGTALLQEHMESARMAANMLLARFSNQGVNLWAVDTVVVPLDQEVVITGISGDGALVTVSYGAIDTPVYTANTPIVVSGVTPSSYNGSYLVVSSSPGQVVFASTNTAAYVSGGIIEASDSISTYSVDPNTVMILDAYVTNTQTGENIDRIILPISRTEYASYPNKEQSGFPTVFWFDRLISPTVTLWPVPFPTNGPTVFKYYRVRRLQDSGFANGQSVEVPYLWLEAFAYGLAQRLSMIWSPEKVPLLQPFADEAYRIAADQNVEQANQYISPQISGYFR
jgi:hypothetical protein